ncbi:MAG TPA: TIGR03560 family F420-dependent LLM class oxidoreductase [Candidatus Bathyarchaeia archaeon]|nr:TIGR03560 family F420-dependent LLM class oxidoreductase [Candidatus Bathyarchaeia archaeon]
MDLGVQIEPQFGFQFDDIVAIANDARAAGFTRLWVSDHFFNDAEAVTTDCLEAWSLLAALAVKTEGIRIGAMVTCQSYRNPALLAKIAAGVDVMSGGRLDFGVGAGWKEIEYRAYGYPFPDGPTRVTQLLETLEICTRMWREKRATFHGKHYRIDDALCSPKPMQNPLPIWIGGSKPRVMRAAARYATAFNFNLGTSARTETLKTAMRQMDDICKGVERDPSTLLRSSFLMSTVGSTSTRSEALLNEFAKQEGTTPAKILEQRPGLLRETPERALGRLREYAAVGIAHANIMFQPYGSEREQIAALAGITAKLA